MQQNIVDIDMDVHQYVHAYVLVNRQQIVDNKYIDVDVTASLIIYAF